MLRERFRSHVAGLRLEREPLVLAVSGGPDSVALLDLMADAAGELGVTPIVAHIDHGIHPESAAVASAVRRLAERYGLPAVVRALNLGGEAGETEAREARYQALHEIRRDAGAALIATAHHADDQAETVLMRVLGGSGPAGLAGMATRQGHIVRPLLPFRRQELAAYVRERQLWFWDDPANRDPRHVRSWLRTEVLPTLRHHVPDVDARLVRVAEAAARDRAAWDRVLDLLPGLDPRKEPEGVSVAAAPLAAYDLRVAPVLLMALARRAGCVLGAHRAERVLRLLQAGRSGAFVPLGDGWIGELAFGRLRIVRPPPVEEQAWELIGRSGSGCWGSWRITWERAPAPAVQERVGRTAYFAAGPLVVRGWRDGERIKPVGGPGRRLVVRCFQDAGVARSLRRRWPALAFGDTIAWLPGICRADVLLPSPGTEALRVSADLV